ncbi:MAG: nucleotidyltransferase domain-containing protein [Deltaproteobacteria bacterium]
MSPHTLSTEQQALIESLAARLSRITGMQAIVLGGSYARGRARPDSDIDLGLLYRPDVPFSIAEVAAIAREVNDTPDPVVTRFYEWGPWVNGGSWLTIGGQRVDFLYKNLDQLEQVIEEARAGRYDHTYYQHPPFGFYSDTYLAELETCIPLYDPRELLAPLKRSIASYPEPLRRRLIQDNVHSAQFDLYSATKAAEAADPYLTNACLIRVINRVVHALFAINSRYRSNDKTAFVELGECALLPQDFCARVQVVASQVGATREALFSAVACVQAIVDETAQLSAEALVVDENSPAWLRHFKKATGH